MIDADDQRLITVGENCKSKRSLHIDIKNYIIQKAVKGYVYEIGGRSAAQQPAKVLLISRLNQ